MIGNRLTDVLFLVGVGLAALLAWQWHTVPRTPAAIAIGKPPSESVVRLEAPQTTVVAPLDEFPQTLERPLFSQTRRPAPLSAVAATPELKPTQATPQLPLAVELSAVILEPDRRLALFRQAAKGSTLLRAEVGQSVDGWVVSEIRDDGVSLQRGGEKQELVLRTFKAPPRPPPVRKKRQARSKRALDRARKKAAADARRRPRRPLRGPRRRAVQRQQQQQQQSRAPKRQRVVPQ